MTISPPPPTPPSPTPPPPPPSSDDENRASSESLSAEVIQKTSNQSSPSEKSEIRQSSSSSSSSDGSKATSRRRRRKVHRLSRFAESSAEVKSEMPSSSSGPPSPYRCFRDKELPKLQLKVPGLSMKTYKWVVWKLWNKLLEDEVDGSLIERSLAHINVLYMLDYSMRTLETPLSVTFGELKQLIQACFDIPTAGRCLIYNRGYMMDHLTLESQGVTSGDCVQVTRPK